MEISIYHNLQSSLGFLTKKKKCEEGEEAYCVTNDLEKIKVDENSKKNSGSVSESSGEKFKNRGQLVVLPHRILTEC